jgi:shikimate 5-dehydrogenase
VTMSLKLKIVDHLDIVTKEAHTIGAVNFMHRDSDGALTGNNWTAEAFWAA